MLLCNVNNLISKFFWKILESKNGKFFEKAVMKTVSAGQYENYLLLQGHLNETSRTIALWHAIYYDNIFFFRS